VAGLEYSWDVRAIQEAGGLNAIAKLFNDRLAHSIAGDNPNRDSTVCSGIVYFVEKSYRTGGDRGDDLETADTCTLHAILPLGRSTVTPRGRCC